GRSQKKEQSPCSRGKGLEFLFLEVGSDLSVDACRHITGNTLSERRFDELAECLAACFKEVVESVASECCRVDEVLAEDLIERLRRNVGSALNLLKIVRRRGSTDNAVRLCAQHRLINDGLTVLRIDVVFLAPSVWENVVDVHVHLLVLIGAELLSLHPIPGLVAHQDCHYTLVCC